MKWFLVIMISFIVFPTTAALAANANARQWSGAVLANSSTNECAKINNPAQRVNIPWVVPRFVLKTKQRMTVTTHVTIGGGNYASFAGYGLEDIGNWIQKKTMAWLMQYGPVRNVGIFSGCLKTDDLEMAIEIRAMTGSDWHQSFRSDSDSSDDKYGSHSRSSSGSNSGQTQGMYLCLQPILYRICADGTKEIVAATAARIAAAESEVIGSQTSYANTSSYSDNNKRYGPRANTVSTNNSSSWGSDGGMSSQRIADSLTEDLSLQAVSLTFQEWNNMIQLQAALEEQAKVLNSCPAQ